MTRKSLVIAYFLWGLGGPWGLHHIYLGRHRQAFLWWATLGGFLGVGWVRDVWRMPEYASGSEPESRHRHRTPPLSWTRLGAEIAFGTVAAVGVLAGLPEEFIKGQWGLLFSSIVIPLVVGLAVNLVGNIGSERASLSWSLVGAYCLVPLFTLNASNPGSKVSNTSITAAIATNWKGKSWKRHGSQTSWTTCLCLLMAAALYFSLWTFAFYNNAYVTTRDGEQIRLRDAIAHIKTSNAVQHPWDTFRMLWATYGANGLGKTWKEFINALDPEGETNAYQVLGVSPGASEKDIKAAYRTLVKMYHPDKVQPGDENVDERFMQIQKAYEKLSSIRTRRSEPNMKDGKDEERDL